MKNTNEIHDLLNHASFKEWAKSSFDVSHPFTTSSYYTTLDSNSILQAKVLFSSLTFPKKNLNLSTRSSILKKIHQNINTEITSDSTNTLKAKRKSNSFKWMGIAASLVALFAVLFVLNTNKIVDVRTDFGEIVNIDLPDGSIVNLDANSSLVMLNDWSNRSARDLRLENSAFFNVTNDPQVGGAGFNVLTEAATVEVIGTEFLVDADGKNLIVVVKTGQVKVSPSSSSNFETQVLFAGDQLIIKDGKLASKENLSSAELKDNLAWINGRISLHHASMIDLETIVKERFNKTLVIDKALRSSNRAVDGSFSILSAKDLLDPVAVALDLQISYNEDVIFLGYTKKN